MAARGKGGPTVTQYLHELPRILADACSIYGRRCKVGSREKAIYKIIKESPEIIRIVNEERLEARRVALLEHRKLGEGGQL